MGQTCLINVPLVKLSIFSPHGDTFFPNHYTGHVICKRFCCFILAGLMCDALKLSFFCLFVCNALLLLLLFLLFGGFFFFVFCFVLLFCFVFFWGGGCFVVDFFFFWFSLFCFYHFYLFISFFFFFCPHKYFRDLPLFCCNLHLTHLRLCGRHTCTENSQQMLMKCTCNALMFSYIVLFLVNFGFFYDVSIC